MASAIDDREYAIPDVNFYSTFSPSHNLYSPRLMRTPTAHSGSINPYPTLKPIPHCCALQQQYLTMCPSPSVRMAPIQEGPLIEAICGNSLMITMNLMEGKQPILIKEINGDDLVFIAKIADGLFGSIHLAEMEVMNDDSAIEKHNVIVKSLSENAKDNQK